MAIQEINVKEITITFNGITTKLISDNEGLFNLNALRKIGGFTSSRDPSIWIRDNESARNLLTELERENPRTTICRRTRGRGAGTWGIEQVVYAYASWISPEQQLAKLTYDAAVIEAFTHAVNGDGKKAVKKAQSVAQVVPREFQQFSKIKAIGTWAHPDIALAYAAVIDIIYQF